MVADLRRSTTALYQSKGSGSFIGVITPCKASVQRIAEFFLYLCRDFRLSVPAVNVYRAALNHVFFLTGMDLASSMVVSRMF